ncbi:MAG: hypothetical protein A3G93_16065 [Nitrospinae bacterium RIFCSPLOWO2_12_FULL_45_22]|nr:MAG: hypothetical protein A3G93_16065 [Nitrospinae bacterium RIFCSPLOWO2_12_FULL_45_22]
MKIRRVITIWAPYIYAGDTGNILNKRQENIGHYRKDGDRIIIYDRQWNKLSKGTWKILARIGKEAVSLIAIIEDLAI